MGRSLLLLGVLALLPERAFAQAPVRIPRDRPSERPYEPPLAPDEKKAEPELPVVPSPVGPIPDSLAANAVWVDALDLSGNEAIPDETLVAAARPYLGRHLSPAQLQQLVVTLTDVYLDAGYANSGAQLPDQQVRDGVLAVRIVEGRLGEVEVVGARYYRPAVLEARLRRAIRAPLRVQQIEQTLRVLEADRRIRRLDARLQPTAERGVARLVVHVDEELPLWVQAGGDNYEPDSVGTAAGRGGLGYDNVLGFGDAVWLDGMGTEGMWQVAGGYEIPVHPSGTTLGAEGWGSQGEIVTSPFDDLDVESDTYTVAGTLDQPLLRTPDHDLSGGLRFEYRWGQTSLLGRDFSFDPGADDGEVKIAVVRPLFEWTNRERAYALAARSLFSVGLDVPGTTEHGGDRPDGQFFAWLAQLRGVYRLSGADVSGWRAWARLELFARLDVQLSDRALLTLEQFALGGPDSVRGYPANYLVRDQAVQGSLEARWPAWTWSHGAHRIELAGFFDAGHGWNQDRPSPGRDTLYGAGVGVHVFPWSTLELVVEYAWPLHDVENAGDSLQAQGLLLGARWRYP